jgi:hypothetical protein
MGDPATKPYGNGVLLWFQIEDFAAAVARARALSAEILEGPHVNPTPIIARSGCEIPTATWSCWPVPTATCDGRPAGSHRLVLAAPPPSMALVSASDTHLCGERGCRCLRSGEGGSAGRGLTSEPAHAQSCESEACVCRRPSARRANRALTSTFGPSKQRAHRLASRTTALKASGSGLERVPQEGQTSPGSISALELLFRVMTYSTSTH